MSRDRREECLDIFRPGETGLRMEVGRNGRARLECPCCEGCGSHSDRPGNNPDALEYDCDTCCGTGDIIQMPELEQPPAWAMSQSEWPGQQLTPHLKLTQVNSQEGTWRIHGAWNKDAAQAGTADLVRLAHAILAHLELPSGMERIEWVRWYRRLMTGATLQEAMEAWERNENGAQQERMEAGAP